MEEVSACVMTSLSKTELGESPLMQQRHLHTMEGTEQLLVAFVVPKEEQVRSMVTHKLALQSKMKKNLPSYCMPDEVVLVKYLPMNQHGNVYNYIPLHIQSCIAYLTDLFSPTSLAFKVRLT